MAAKSDALQIIADEFVSSLPERMTAINAACDALSNAPAEAELLNDFYHKVHNLTGSSGTFGFNQFSTIARNILVLLEPAMKEKCPPTDEAVQAVKPLLEELSLEAKAPVQLEDWL